MDLVLIDTVGTDVMLVGCSDLMTLICSYLASDLLIADVLLNDACDVLADEFQC